MNGPCNLVDLPGSIPLSTRKGREIPNDQAPDVDPRKAEAVSAKHRKRYPFAIQRRRPTGQYNCHGLTFANRRTAIRNPGLVKQILEDDGYREISVREVDTGDVIAYYSGGAEIEHTGVVLEVVDGEPKETMLRSVKVISKWGDASEYIHLAHDAPYSTSRKYWTDRP